MYLNANLNCPKGCLLYVSPNIKRTAYKQHLCLNATTKGSLNSKITLKDIQCYLEQVQQKVFISVIVSSYYDNHCFSFCIKTLNILYYTHL